MLLYEDTMAKAKRHGGTAPKGKTKGGGPNGSSGLSNSAPQEKSKRVPSERNPAVSFVDGMKRTRF